jgi:hypothetical protein
VTAANEKLKGRIPKAKFKNGMAEAACEGGRFPSGSNVRDSGYFFGILT